MLGIALVIVGPAPHGAGGLKLLLTMGILLIGGGPAPHGAGGLKWKPVVVHPGPDSSRPARGGWIEISIVDLVESILAVPPRTGRVD